MTAPPPTKCGTKGCHEEAITSPALGSRCWDCWRAFRGLPVSTRADRPRTCDVKGCNEPHRGHGLCVAHLQRLKRTGTVRADEPIERRR